MKCWCGEEHFHPEYKYKPEDFTMTKIPMLGILGSAKHDLLLETDREVPSCRTKIVEVTDFGRTLELICDCGRTNLATAISETLFEWNCPECGLMRDTDA